MNRLAALSTLALCIVFTGCAPAEPSDPRVELVHEQLAGTELEPRADEIADVMIRGCDPDEGVTLGDLREAAGLGREAPLPEYFPRPWEICEAQPRY